MFDANDPRWTAYILNELTPTEVAECEQILASDPAAIQAVKETRCMLERLTNELQGEPCPTLNDEQRAVAMTGAILAQPEPIPVGAKKWYVRHRWLVGGVAALLLVGVGVLWPLSNKIYESARIAFSPNKQQSQEDGPQSENAVFAVENPRWNEKYKSSPNQSQPNTIVVVDKSESLIEYGPSDHITLRGTVATNKSTFSNPNQTTPYYIQNDAGYFPPGAEIRLNQSNGEGRSDPNGTARFASIHDNKFLTPADAPLSTFAIDVDTASYAIARRLIQRDRRLPPPDAVRIEEFVNYFRYNYAPPAEAKGEDAPPFAVHAEVATCPWEPAHRLVKIGLKGREMAKEERPASNFVFLLDVSGSMSPADRLPMILEAMEMLVAQFNENDRVAIVVYASEVGVKLPSTACDAQGKKKINDILNSLHAGGSTSGGEGIQTAYRVAMQNFIQGGTNRVILATDGDFNVGITDTDQLIGLIADQANSGVSLTTLGVGNDNINDAMMEKLVDKGHGNYHYLDSLREAKKILVEQMTGTLHTIAKDVKIQIEFNPAEVASYRQIGYENRIMAKEDFNNDKKLGGDIGAGHTVTALYEIVPVKRKDAEDARPEVDGLKYQKNVAVTDAAKAGEMLTLKLRYKTPQGDTSKLIESPIKDDGKKLAEASNDFRFAAAVAAYGMILRDSPFKGQSSFALVQEMAQAAVGADLDGHRLEFVDLIRQAAQLKGQ